MNITCPGCAELISEQAHTCPLCRTPIPGAKQPPNKSTPKGRAAARPSSGGDIASFWVIGIAMAVLGGCAALVGVSEDGTGFFIAGIVVASIGGIVLQVALIATGVDLALRAQERRGRA